MNSSRWYRQAGVNMVGNTENFTENILSNGRQTTVDKATTTRRLWVSRNPSRRLSCYTDV